MSPTPPRRDRVPVRIVLADANVLYSRVLRDYVLYAATEDLISVKWSQKILDEMTRNLIKNVATFDDDAAAILVRLMNENFTTALVEPGPEHFEAFADMHMPDEGDRHVLAAAIAAEATVLCTSDVKHFPDDVMARVGIKRMTPDMLIAGMVTTDPDDMLEVHRLAVGGLKGATDASTLDALVRANAPQAAEQMAHELSMVLVRSHVRDGHIVHAYLRRR